MKIRNLTAIAAACYSLMLFNSCGTISNGMSHGKSPVFMIAAPKDLEVTSAGKKLDIESEVFAASSNIGGTVTTTYYTAAVKLPHNRKASLDLYSPSMNKKATVAVRPKVSGTLIFLDIIFFGVGLPIDIITGNLTVLKPRLVDAENLLNGKPSRSQGKLKRMTKRKIKHGK
jgi:hypothetical protein